MVALAHQLRALEDALDPGSDGADLETALHHLVDVAADAYHALPHLQTLDALNGRDLCDEAIDRFRSLRAKLESAELTAKVDTLRVEDLLLATHVEALRMAASLLVKSWEQMLLEIRRSLGFQLNPNGRAAMLAVIDDQLKMMDIGREVLETLRRRVHEAMPPRAVQLGDLPDEIVDDLLRAAMQQARFADLAEIWRNETAHLSSTSHRQAPCISRDHRDGDVRSPSDPPRAGAPAGPLGPRARADHRRTAVLARRGGPAGGDRRCVAALGARARLFVLTRGFD